MSNLASLLKLAPIDSARMSNLEGAYKLDISVVENGSVSNLSVLLPDFCDSIEPKHALQIAASFIRTRVANAYPALKCTVGFNTIGFLDSSKSLSVRLTLESASVSLVPSYQLSDFSCLLNALGAIRVSKSNLETLVVTAELNTTANNYISVHFDKFVEVDGAIELTPSVPSPAFLPMFRKERCLVNSLHEGIKNIINDDSPLVIFNAGKTILDTKDNTTRPNDKPGTVIIK